MLRKTTTFLEAKLTELIVRVQGCVDMLWPFLDNWSWIKLWRKM